MGESGKGLALGWVTLVLLLTNLTGLEREDGSQLVKFHYVGVVSANQLCFRDSFLNQFLRESNILTQAKGSLTYGLWVEEDYAPAVHALLKAVIATGTEEERGDFWVPDKLGGGRPIIGVPAELCIEWRERQRQEWEDYKKGADEKAAEKGASQREPDPKESES